MTINARALEHVLCKLLSHPLREVREELGLNGRVVEMVGAYAFPAMNQVILAYHVAAEGEIELARGRHAAALEKFRFADREDRTGLTVESLARAALAAGEIAARLGTAVKTVDSHKRNICEKLGLDPKEQTPGAKILHKMGASLVNAMEEARSAGDPDAAQMGLLSQVLHHAVGSRGDMTLRAAGGHDHGVGE